jgi:hypothetical protein
MFHKILIYIFSAMLLVFSVSCGKSNEQEVKDAILEANNYLSTRQCQPAIDLLESMGRQNRNSYYLKALSSAYACRAGYSTTTFFGTDISKTTSPSPLGGMTTYTSSQVTSTSPLATDSKFKDLQTAIDILLYAGGIGSTTEPTMTERAKYFSAGQAGDINAQLLFMTLVQTGKLMKVYADADASGVKGGGSAGNNCFTNYTTTPAAVQTYIGSGNTGACTVTNSSHSQLAVGVSGRRARLCQGVVLLNTLIDILPGVIATAGGGDLTTIEDMSTDISAFKTILIAADPSFVATATVMSQANCEADAAITLDTLASYYAVIFESIVK